MSKCPYIKVTQYLSVARILLTARPIWFSFTAKLQIEPEKVYTILEGRAPPCAYLLKNKKRPLNLGSWSHIVKNM